LPQKRQFAWDWKRGCASQSSLPLEKKKKVAKAEKASTEKFVCLECLELSLQGKREDRFTTLCRSDQYSIKQHKERWHKLPSGGGNAP
jgi:hypothetical protein